ncbi:hypothetical protein EZJ49_01220 [Bdellovibrio bacteriovorus]|uniref:hypothetical protein n=1 Tax=Bdellovibrio bacteriovorus TaxID=959 RepID=UPI0021D309F1|nr:hypothetical protein [Bdellovibrio bacteriovorus]UXR64869.1 hypothetical protein EZJ49_01220 [Bdellovibrio bacteriovorus]
MLTLERLAELMQNNVHRVDGNFPYDVTLYDDNPEENDGIDVKYTDDEGNVGNVWIEEIVSVDENGLIHCQDHLGSAIEVEIFQRVTKFDLMVNGANNGA